MRRHSRGIALVVVIAMAMPFLVQLLSRLTTLDPLPVAALLFVLVVAGFVVAARRSRADDPDR